MQIQVKRAYEEPLKSDGRRILVDRIWPRGIGREQLQLDDWSQDIAPSTKLRKWFGHDPAKWAEFKRRYFVELDQHSEVVKGLLAQTDSQRLTLVFGARDELHNQAVALKEYLLKSAGRHSPRPGKSPGRKRRSGAYGISTGSK